VSSFFRSLPILIAAALASGIFSSVAFAQGFSPAGGQGSPMCQRLEGQLATIDQGQGGANNDQIRRYQDAATKQQAELERVQAQAQRQGCDSSGFFSLFNGRSAQCGPVNNQIQQMRANLDQMTSSLERLRAGTGGQDDPQRRSVILALAQNNCGPQYANMARSGNFLTNLFGGGGNPGDSSGVDPNAPQSGTYRTVCARSCDGSYFPISFATVPSRFADDEKTCKSLCPNAEVTLYTYHNPGEDISQAVSLNGQPYSQSPNAFRFRTQYDKTCSCRAPGQSWADALKNVDDSSAAAQGDIIVTDDRAKKMAQPPKTPAPAKTSASPADVSSAPAAPAAADSGDKQIRSVGPTFIPNNR
jgi:hypothetical protein